MALPSSTKIPGRISSAAPTLSKQRVLVGFDGFVDTILHVVDKRESASKYIRMAKMASFAERIRAAAGLSANFEFVTQMIKLGGNGPIMANAIGSYGAQVSYIGNLGAPHLHPIFEDFSRKTTVCSLAEPGYTDAIEFEDGKLMCGKNASLKEVTWQTLMRCMPLEQVIAKFSESSLIALVNWTMLPFMDGIFRKILTEVAPQLMGQKRWVFFDLADPAKRTREDIAGVLKTITKFQKYFRVILGLNLQESRQIGEVLGLKPPTDKSASVTDHAARLFEKMGVETVVIHPTHYAAAADATGASAVDGPFTPTPKITTGAGDHFNAGFCVGRLLECNLAESLRVGVATSGFYVRQARSPSLEDLKRFLAKDWTKTGK